MVDIKEKDEASKSNSSPKEDASQIVLSPPTVPSTSIMLVERRVVGPGNAMEEPDKVKDEGNTMVKLEIGQGHKKEKNLTEGETDNSPAVGEVVVRGNGEEKTKEHINGENLVGSSKGKGSKSRKRNKKKKITQKASVMVADANEAKATVSANNEGLAIEATHKEDTVKEASVKGETKEKIEEKKNGENLGESSNRRGRKPKRNRKKKVAEKASEMVVVDGVKPESSSKKKASEKVKSMGMVFMCSSKTKADCFRYKILGLPAGKKDQVAKVYKGMRLFLFDVDLRLMYGIFKAAEAGGYNIEPKAFKSAFPSQVRFTVMEDCLPLAEEKFRNVIKENYYSRNKFECQLNVQQVKKLCKLFVAGKRGPSPQKSIKNHQSGADESRRGRGDRDRKKRKRWAREEERQPHPSLGRERRRYHDYGQPPVRYEREALPSPVRPVARYLPPRPQDLAPVRSYGYERAYSYSYARDPVLEHRSYHALDTEPRQHDEMVRRRQEHDREHRHLYGREPLTYRDDVYPSVGQTVEYHHLSAAALPSQYRLVSRDYPPPAIQPAEYHLSGGLQASGYRDVGNSSEYRSSAASALEYRPGRPRYGY